MHVHQFLRDEFQAGATDCSERVAQQLQGLSQGQCIAVATDGTCCDACHEISSLKVPQQVRRCRQDVGLDALALLVFGAERDFHEEGTKKRMLPWLATPGRSAKTNRVGRPSRGVSPHARTSSPQSGQRTSGTGRFFRPVSLTTTIALPPHARAARRIPSWQSCRSESLNSSCSQRSFRGSGDHLSPTSIVRAGSSPPTSRRRRELVQPAEERLPAPGRRRFRAATRRAEGPR